MIYTNPQKIVQGMEHASTRQVCAAAMMGGMGKHAIGVSVHNIMARFATFKEHALTLMSQQVALELAHVLHHSLGQRVSSSGARLPKPGQLSCPMVWLEATTLDIRPAKKRSPYGVLNVMAMARVIRILAVAHVTLSTVESRVKERTVLWSMDVSATIKGSAFAKTRLMTTSALASAPGHTLE